MGSPHVHLVPHMHMDNAKARHAISGLMFPAHSWCHITLFFEHNLYLSITYHLHVACCRSAVLIRMGVDTLSASEFMQLIESEPSVTGLTDKREYNAFLVLADPADKLASLVLKVASSTQVSLRA